MFDQIINEFSRNQLALHRILTGTKKTGYRRIPVINQSSTYILDNGVFKCGHDRVIIEEPCCSGYDKYGHQECGCGGERSVWCEDCGNKELTDQQAEEILNDGQS